LKMSFNHGWNLVLIFFLNFNLIWYNWYIHVYIANSWWHWGSYGSIWTVRHQNNNGWNLVLYEEVGIPNMTSRSRLTQTSFYSNCRLSYCSRTPGFRIRTSEAEIHIGKWQFRKYNTKETKFQHSLYGRN
jgi:hypothetical protein